LVELTTKELVEQTASASRSLVGSLAAKAEVKEAKSEESDKVEADSKDGSEAMDKEPFLDGIAHCGEDSMEKRRCCS